MVDRESRKETLEKLSVRDYQDRDLDAFVSLVRSSLSEFGYGGDSKYDLDLEDPGSYYDKIWLIEGVDGSIIGSVGAKRRSVTEAQIKRMYVDANYRGHGHGQRLLKSALGWARQEGLETLWLVTTNLMKEAQKFYERAGFKQMGNFPDWDYVHPQDIYYRLEFGPGEFEKLTLENS